MQLTDLTAHLVSWPFLSATCAACALQILTFGPQSLQQLSRRLRMALGAVFGESWPSCPAPLVQC